MSIHANRADTLKEAVVTIRWSYLWLAFVISCSSHAEVPELVQTTFNRLVPGVAAINIEAAPIEGWYQGQVGSRLLYVNADASRLLDGQIFDLNSRENLTENALNSVRQQLMAAVDESSMIIFRAPEERYQVSVFTDVDCGYCRKLHNSMARYHQRGISVRYLAFPRAGMGSKTAKIMQSVWCSDDRGDALSRAKQGEKLTSGQCDDPVEEHYHLGNAVGVNGTPAIVFESGRLVPGFVDADQLMQMLDQG